MILRQSFPIESSNSSRLWDLLGELKKYNVGELVNQLDEALLSYRQSSNTIDGEELNDKYINAIEGIRKKLVRCLDKGNSVN